MIRRLVDRAARAYVAGPELGDAVEVARTLAHRGFASTIAYWNDTGEAPADVRDHYLAALDGAHAVGAGCYVSVKAPALRSSLVLLTEVAEHAAKRRLGLHLDALGAEDQETAMELLRDLRPLELPLGCTLPGRWARSLDHAERAIELGLRVRVVKGQWEAPRGEERDPRRGFLEVVERLSGRAPKVAVATHDPELAEEALACLHLRGTPAELELLYGLPTRAARAVAKKRGIPVRLYVPYGRAWLPYSLRQAKKNPRILWWILEDAVRGRSLLAEEAP